MTLFVDTTIFYAAANRSDRFRARAQELLAGGEQLLTSDHVLVEAWQLIRTRLGSRAAQAFWEGIRSGVARVEHVSAADLESAWHIGQAFADQEFSLVDLTSFAIIERLGISQVASFDNDFAIVRLGPRRDRALTVLR